MEQALFGDFGDQAVWGILDVLGVVSEQSDIVSLI